MRSRSRSIVLCALAALSLSGPGCSPALGLQDWQRDLLSAAFGLVGGAIGAGSVQVIVQRECFENGVRVDCSQIPLAP